MIFLPPMLMAMKPFPTMGVLLLSARMSSSATSNMSPPCVSLSSVYASTAASPAADTTVTTKASSFCSHRSVSTWTTKWTTMSPATPSAGPPRILTTFNPARPSRAPQRTQHHVSPPASILPQARIASPGHWPDQLLLRPVSPKLARLTLSSATPEARAHQHLADPLVSTPLLP